MEDSTKLIASILIISIIIGIVAFFLLKFLLSTFYVAQPGISNLIEIDYVLSSGIAASAFSIIILFYPVYKKGVSNGDWEDFR